MDRVRRAGQFVLFVAIALSAPWHGPDRPLSPTPAAVIAAAVSWPVSSLLVSEVMTGGASASDEFVELANAGSEPVDLTGFELVYATSSGGTVTRKAAWTSPTILEPGRHLLVANVTGVHAATADATYSGGFAATGGSVALRPIGGEAVDAVGWGDATNAFVEGVAAPAPASGSSIERLPGGPLGNGADSNDNAIDFVVRGSPTPQNMASAATPAPGPSPAPTPTPTPATTPTTTPSPTETPTPTPAETLLPTVPPTEAPSPTPTPTPVPTPSATPTPAPTAPPTPAPTATPDAVAPIADARVLPDGSVVSVRGTLTTALGAIESGRIGFLQDTTAGIAIRLDAALAAPLPAGSTVEMRGAIGSYFSLQVLNVEAATIVAGDPSALPSPRATVTGSANDSVEAVRLIVSGTVTSAPSELTDGLGVTIDDGTGPLRIVVAPAALLGAEVGTGDVVTAIGPLGQRDSSGTGTASYRIHATSSGEFTAGPAPTPTPSPSPTPTQSSTPGPSASPGPTATPTPAPTSSPTPTPVMTPIPSPSPVSLPIGSARRLPIGTIVAVAGVVTAEAGRLGAQNLIAVQDSSGGIVIRLPDGTASPARGAWLEIRGSLADPYGQIELRPASSGMSADGSAPVPDPVPATATSLGESLEGRLVTVHGRIEARPTKSSGGDVTFYVASTGGRVRIVADASSGLTADSVVVGATYDVVGVAGQRASRKGALDGYRVWTRDSGDLGRVSVLGPTPTSTPSGGPTPTSSPTTSPPPVGHVISIADAIRLGEGQVTVEGLVTTRPDLLDSTGRRIVMEDRTAGVEILLPTDGSAPAVGARIRVDGTIGRAYDAPRVKAERVATVAVGARPLALDLQRPPTAAHEWRLVRTSGTVVEVRKLGDRWRAELSVGRDRVVVSGLTGAKIPPTTLIEGRAATVVGIVRRPYPGASDRRWSIAPRSPADVVVGRARAEEGGDRGDPPAGPGAAATRTTSPSAAPNVDLVDLAVHDGKSIRVGGLVTELATDGFLLDDGTAVGRIVLGGAAAEYLPLLEPGDALNATGRVQGDGGTYRIVVDDPAGLVRVGDPTLDPVIGRPAAPQPSVRESSAPEVVGRQAGGLIGSGSPGTAGVLGIVLVSLASVAVTLLRRRRSRRILATRVASRLAGVAATHEPN